MVDALTGEVNVSKKPLNLKGLKELLDGRLLLDGLLQCNCFVSRVICQRCCREC